MYFNKHRIGLSGGLLDNLGIHRFGAGLNDSLPLQERFECLYAVEFHQVRVAQSLLWSVQI
jgi:hypothetical protein